MLHIQRASIFETPNLTDGSDARAQNTDQARLTKTAAILNVRLIIISTLETFPVRLRSRYNLTYYLFYQVSCYR